MPTSLSARLSLMMFLNYVIWGAWYVTIATYLTQTLHFTGAQAGAVFGTSALACMISPFFVGLIADRYFATERVLSALHLVGAGLLFLVTRVNSFAAVYTIMLAYCICYFPTVSLTNSLTLRQVKNASSEFPRIRVFATLGWVAIAATVGFLRVEASSSQFLLAAGASVVMGLYSLTLPHTPPAGKGKQVSMRTVLGLDALVMFRERSYRIFAIASVLACIPLTFYFSFTNDYLNDLHVQNAAGKMSLGQVSEVGVMLLMPFIYRRFTLKAILMIGLLAWSVRYALLALGNAGGNMWMLYAAILMHGVCFDFFFMTGQLYTDQEAPAHLRATAQGLLAFLTYGAGMFIGSHLSGEALDFFTTGTGDTLKHDWVSFWIGSGLSAFVILLVVAFFFRDKGKVQNKETAEAAA